MVKVLAKNKLVIYIYVCASLCVSLWVYLCESVYTIINSLQLQKYRRPSNISRSQHLNFSRLVLELLLPTPLKPAVKWRMNM